MNFKQTAVKAVKAAGKIQLKYFGKKIKKRKKQGDSYVTEVDIKSIEIIRKIILDQFPDHDVVDEELGHRNKRSNYKWIIDPLDGTHNFIMQNPLFGISIALQYKKEIILGVIYFPVLKKLYYTKKGKGSFCNEKRIKVNNEKKLKKCLFLFDVKLRSKTDMKIKMLKNLSKQTWRLRMYGVATYNLISVAEGYAAFTVDFDSNIWDHSAGFLLVEEAGGKVTDLNGKKWTYYTRDYVASNSKVHDKVLNVLKK